MEQRQTLPGGQLQRRILGVLACRREFQRFFGRAGRWLGRGPLEDVGAFEFVLRGTGCFDPDSRR